MALTEHIKHIAIGTLKESPLAESLKKDIDSLYKYQEALYVYAGNPDESGLNTLKIGTVLAFSVIGKIIQGKEPKAFDKSDWEDILDNVVDYGIMIDPQRYTEFVFELFAAYIDFSVDINKETVKGKPAKEIKAIADEIRSMTKNLEKGEIKEADYVDRCLWSSFEAMIKLLAIYSTKGFGEEYALFIQAVADFSVQYGRLALYRKELDILRGYIEGQEKLDEQLDAKFSAYLKELQAESNIFDDLIANAFSEDFDKRLRNSVDLAKKAGVSDDIILDSQEKIDSFFMG